MNNESNNYHEMEQEKARWDAEQERRAAERIRRGEVVISGIKIPFWDLVILFVKAAFASIPAMIIVSLVISFFMSMMHGFMR